jgi:hypothetical protein
MTIVLPAGGTMPPQVAGSDQRVPLPTGGSGALGGGGGEPETGGIGVLGGGIGVAGAGVGAGGATGGVDGVPPGAGAGMVGVGAGAGVGAAAGDGAAGVVGASVLSPPPQAARVAVNSTANAIWRICRIPSEWCWMARRRFQRRCANFTSFHGDRATIRTDDDVRFAHPPVLLDTPRTYLDNLVADSNSPSGAQGLADRLIERALTIVTPVVRLLVAYGVTYPRFAAALKRVFFDAAAAELDATGKKRTDSALSLLSGLHRRDTHALGRLNPTGLPPKVERASTAQQVALRWSSVPDYLDADGQPRDLPFKSVDASEASFAQLAQSVSKDVHPLSVLEELVRLGLADFDGTRVRRRNDLFVPADFDELALLMTGSTHDHLAAAVANLRGREPRFLEYSLFSDELRPDSVEALHTTLKQRTRELFRDARAQAVELTDQDRAKGFADAPEMRMRFGVFFYAEPMQRPAPTPAADAPDMPKDQDQ